MPKNYLDATDAGGGDAEQDLLSKTHYAEESGGTSNWVIGSIAVAYLLIILGVIAFGMAIYNTDRIDNLPPQPVSQVAPFKQAGWWSWGFDETASRRYNGFAPGLYKMRSVCSFDTITGVNGVSTTITTDEETGIAYFGDWGTDRVNAAIWAINLETCTAVKKILVNNLSSSPASAWTIDNAGNITTTQQVVRGSLTIALNSTQQKVLVFADLGTSHDYNHTLCIANGYCGPRMYVIDPVTWQYVIRNFFSSGGYSGQMTGSPTIYGQNAFFPVSSSAELQIGDPTSPNYKVSDFNGALVAIDINDGSQTYQQTQNGAGTGNPGAGVWLSSPPVDAATQQIFFGTGNLYNQSQTVSLCLQSGRSRQACSEVYKTMSDSIFALDISNSINPFSNLGLYVNFYFSPYGVDAWNLACLDPTIAAGNCPYPAGPDYDFGPGAVVIPQARLLVMMQKSGVMWFINIDTRLIETSVYVGPGSIIENNWGLAYDDNNVYVSIGNFDKRTWVDTDGFLHGDGGMAAVCWTVDCRAKVQWMKPLPCSRASAVCPTGLVADSFLVGDVPTADLLYTSRYVNGAPMSSGAVPCPSSPAADSRDAPFFAMSVGAVTLSNNYLFTGSATGYVYSWNVANGDIIGVSPRCPTGIIYGGVTLTKGSAAHPWLLTWGCGYYDISFLPSNAQDSHVMVAELF